MSDHHKRQWAEYHRGRAAYYERLIATGNAFKGDDESLQYHRRMAQRWENHSA